MQIVRNILENVSGIEWFPIISLLIFFTFFILVIIRVMRIQKFKIEEYKWIPFDDEFKPTD